MQTVTYFANASHGVDWLTDEDWRALEQAGWRLEEKVWAHKVFPTLEAGVREWRQITLQDPDEPGCWCCGCPHQFYAITWNGVIDRPRLRNGRS